MKKIILDAPRGNSTLRVKLLTGTPDKFIFTINSKLQPQAAKSQKSQIILFNKYELQFQLKNIQNSDCAFTNQLVKERYKEKPEARVFSIFSLTRAFPTFYKYRD